MNKNIEQLNSRFAEQYQQWEKSQQGQDSGYDYEKSFVEMWQQLGQQVFQQSMGALKKSRNTKKTSNKLRRVRNTQRTRHVKYRSI